ncbi:hypothetical protein Tco_0849697 [Tanacetum coccineum]
MAVLESCPKHNMVAYLEKTDGNTEFHEIISFLTRSSIHYALTVTDQAKEIKQLKAQIKKLKKKAKPIIIHHIAWMKSGRKSAKAEPTVHIDPVFNKLDDDEIDNMETEDAQDVGRTRYVVHEEKESTKKDVSNEDAHNLMINKQVQYRQDQRGGTVDQTKGRSATPTTPTPTPTIFGDDETIAQVSRRRVVVFYERKEQKFLMLTVAAQRGFLAEQRAATIRNRPPTRTQSRKDSEMNEELSDFNKKREVCQKVKDVLTKVTIDIEIIGEDIVIARLGNKVSSPDGGYLVIYRANGNFKDVISFLEGTVLSLTGKILSHMYDCDVAEYSEKSHWKELSWILWGD